MNQKNSFLTPKIKKDYLPMIVMAGLMTVLTLFCRATGYSLVLPVMLFFVGLHLHMTERIKYDMFLKLSLLLTILLALAHVLVNYFDISIYYLPISGVALLTMLLFNNLSVVFMMVLLSSLLATITAQGGFDMFFVFMIGALSGAYAVRGARRRGQLFFSGLIVGVMHLVALALVYPDPYFFMEKDFLVGVLYPLLFSGVNAALVAGAMLKVFEMLFGVITNFSLLELADFNQPLLRRMILEAPGTYHHSLVVSNLSEAAADAIGANALLTRVGAYYHDIGKMVKPEYFTENQMMGFNIHDRIEPSMSRLVILNHVKEGIEMAKKYKLNPAIAQFIPQHHGTSLIYYFYQKSLEAAADGEVIIEENYRYPGPKPQSRETAITLLADSVEGATRALSEPNPNNIEDTVKKVVNNKFIDGQLDECPLTLKEIDRISSTFIRILCAMYHGRVKYPEKKNGSSPRKSADKTETQPKPDQKDHGNDSTS